MRKFHTLVLSAALVAVPLVAPFAFGAESLDSLLHGVQSVRADMQAQFQQNAAAYNAAAPAEQANMLREAQAKRDALSVTSDSLTASYSDNEIKINEANKQLRDKANLLGLQEVFGLARQAATDGAAGLQQSLITTQFPAKDGEMARDDFLRSFGAAQKQPTAADLERVWFELQREMTAQGQVAKYKGKIVQPGGESVDATIIRVGPFTATADGKFLSYRPSLRTLNVFPRQLPDEFLAIADGISSATSGYVKAVVDSTRGVLLSLYVERPTWGKRIELGEEIGYIILAVGFAGTIAFIFQVLHLIMVRIGVTRQLRNLSNLTTNNPLGRVLLAFKGDPSMIEQDADVAELRISEAVLKELPSLDRFQAFLRLCVAAGPLLGLIGTVVGMIITFQSITESGSSDPKLMANGIGQAMIATVLGLGIAIPLLFANALLNALSRGVAQVLDEQAVGMLAERIERQRRA